MVLSRHLFLSLQPPLLTAGLEGSWTDVMTLIGQAHQMLHEQGIVRIQSDIRVGSRTDKTQTMQDKVSAVEKLLAADTHGGDHHYEGEAHGGDEGLGAEHYGERI